MAKKQTNRIVGLDLFRVISMLFIFLYHTSLFLECKYGFLTPFIRMGGTFMTGFFLLSGFALYLTYNNKDLSNISELKVYYLKRFIGIVPVYYLVSVIFACTLGKEDLKSNILLAPIEMFGIQSTSSGFFWFTHNSSTWFVSCILICYLIYPFIQEIIKQLKVKGRIIMGLVFAFVLLWSCYAVAALGTGGIYSNPFFRAFEFAIGAILCSLTDKIKESGVSRLLFSRISVIIEAAALVAIITLLYKNNFYTDNTMAYSVVAVPMFSLILVSISGITKSPLEGSRILKFACDISYTFYLAQFFVWELTPMVLVKIGMIGNKTRIGVSFILCFVISLALHFLFEKPVTALLKKYLLKK